MTNVQLQSSTDYTPPSQHRDSRSRSSSAHFASQSESRKQLCRETCLPMARDALRSAINSIPPPFVPMLRTRKGTEKKLPTKYLPAECFLILFPVRPEVVHLWPLISVPGNNKKTLQEALDDDATG